MIRKAQPEQAGEIHDVVVSTISEIYPKYYTKEVVDFFIGYHSPERIREDISAGKVYIAEEDGRIAGTGTVNGDNIERVYVRPEYRGKGIGSEIMDFLEKEILKEHEAVVVESSLPAGEFYRRRKYVQVRHMDYPVDNGKILCYEVMHKTRTAPVRPDGKRLKAAAYQFRVSADIRENAEKIRKAIAEAAGRQADLAVFPECALTGYPPRDIPSASQVDFALAEESLAEIRAVCDRENIAAVLGMAAREEDRIYNRAVFLSPGAEPVFYDKRALWGWDRENFTPGCRDGIVEYRGFRIGIRICYEVRFPEYFRELYRAGTDLDVVLFRDVSDTDDEDRYSLIRGHLRTRAVENVCAVVSANAVGPFQTAPTAVIGGSGQVIAECRRNEEGFAEFVLERGEPGFGEKGRMEISDSLLGVSGN